MKISVQAIVGVKCKHLSSSIPDSKIKKKKWNIKISQKDSTISDIIVDFKVQKHVSLFKAKFDCFGLSIGSTAVPPYMQGICSNIPRQTPETTESTRPYTFCHNEFSQIEYIFCSCLPPANMMPFHLHLALIMHCGHNFCSMRYENNSSKDFLSSQFPE